MARPVGTACALWPRGARALTPCLIAFEIRNPCSRAKERLRRAWAASASLLLTRRLCDHAEPRRHPRRSGDGAKRPP
eukprot:5415181-Pyramimonas_sp.AAC.1